MLFWKGPTHMNQMLPLVQCEKTKKNILRVLETNICNRMNTAAYTWTLSEKSFFSTNSSGSKKHKKPQNKTEK